MSSENISFTKNNIDEILKELGKEYYKLNKHGQQVELVIVGGVSAIINYNFRDTTTDIDGLYYTNWAFKDAIDKVGDKYNLPNGWLNNDFKHTTSYSDKLVLHSKYYKSFYNLNIRTVSGEYAIAMKLVSGRTYKNDISDIIGILKDEKNKGNVITYEKINKAVLDLYENWDKISEQNKAFLEKILNHEDLEQLYLQQKIEETNNKSYLRQAKEQYKEKVTSSNVDSFINFFKQNNSISNANNISMEDNNHDDDYDDYEL